MSNLKGSPRRGNVALILAVLLLASLFTGGVAAASSMPANGSVVGTATISVDGSGNVSLSLAPTTGTDFSSYLGNNVLHAILRLQQSGGSYQVEGSVYGTVYTAAYSAVYSNVYLMPANLQLASTSQSVYFNQVNGAVYLSVYLDLETKPPASGGGGGGSIAVASTSNATTTSAGTVTVSNGTASVSVSSTAVQSAVQQAQSPNATQITLDASVPSSTSTSSSTSTASSAPVATTQIAVPSTALASLATVNKPVEVKSSDGAITLPPAVIQQLSQATTAPSGTSQSGTAQSGTAQISLSAQSESSVSQALSQAATASPEANAGLQAAGGSVTFTVTVQSSTGTSTDVGEHLAAPVTIHVPFNTGTVTTVTAPLAGIYRLDPTSNTWQYVGPCGAPAAGCAGRIDPASGTASVSRSSLSTYAVMTFNKVFTDMVGHWAAGDVQIAAAHHVVGGMTSTTFGPDLTVTRAQFAAMVQRLLMLPVPSTTSAFSDVSADDWFAGAVAAAAQAGVVNGFPDGTFHPNDPITREQMATMITRAMTAGGVPASVTNAQQAQLLSGFGDSGQVSAWAANALAVAINNSILKGKPEGLVPQGDATRAEAAAMLKRLLVYFGAF